MIDLLSPKTDADRLATLRKISSGKIKAGCDGVESKQVLMPTKELAEVIGIEKSTLTRLALEFPHIVTNQGSCPLLFKSDSALALTNELGMGKFGNDRYLRIDIAKACRVNPRSFKYWVNKQDDLPPFTTLKNRRPAWTSADAEIVVSRYEEYLYQ